MEHSFDVPISEETPILRKDSRLKTNCFYYLVSILLLTSFIMTFSLNINKLYYKFNNQNIINHLPITFVLLNIFVQILGIMSNNIILLISYKHHKNNWNFSPIKCEVNGFKLIFFFMTYNIVYVILFEKYEFDSTRADTFISSLILNNIESIQLVLIYYNLDFAFSEDICGDIIGHQWMFNISIMNIILHMIYDLLVSMIDTEIFMKDKELVFEVLFDVYNYFYQWFITYIFIGMGRKLLWPNKSIKPIYNYVVNN